MTLFIFQIVVKIRIHHQTRSGILYKLIYRGIFYPAFFLCACERSFETASFCPKFWFSSRRPWKLILSIFFKSKRPCEKQTTPRLVTYLYLSMDKIWAKMIFWLWPWNFDFARFLQTFPLNTIACVSKVCFRLDFPMVCLWVLNRWHRLSYRYKMRGDSDRT